jgi:predicted transposase YbfD/YdcC
VSKGHGRIVRHCLEVSTRLAGHTDWPGLAQVCRLSRTTICKGKQTVEIEYAITSVPRAQAGATRLLNWWRGHWGIENRSHYVRDVTFQEDACQIHSGHAPENLAALRNGIISLLRLQGHKNIAGALRSYIWQPSRLLAMLGIFKQ